MLLDEPTTGLDPRSKREVQGFIAEVRRDAKVTILLTTHDMDEAEQLCGRIGFLSGGRLVAEGTPLELRQAGGGRASRSKRWTWRPSSSSSPDGVSKRTKTKTAMTTR